ncbi:hypothetical protein POM88_047101 [Heracleum sosnowskyi]|uniref:Uncharacterized protein n=1 Tax=Heracleum sosnowskyi TaxID=360622 RepID=A0AAD8M7R3_9APIA|nr:hypothetical protein POM88_047101 [Heracleum sosnowskyi]
MAQIKISIKKNRRKKMYPKVKVRDEAQDVDEDDYATRFYKALDALSLQNFPSPPVKELEDNSLPSVVRIPKSYVSKPIMPLAPVSKGSAKSINRKIVEEEKQNIRASSVPRPRAVLSSPDNDGLLKSKQKSRQEISSGLKNHNQRQNRHAQCKVIPTSIDAINRTREANEAAHSRINPKVIRVSPSEPNNKAYLRKG